MKGIIAGFPGIGKTHLANSNEYNVVDSDSSKFSWIKEGVRHPDFPNNYMNHIKEKVEEFDIVLVSTHKIVREALYKNNFFYHLVFPQRICKKEYIERYSKRGSNEAFLKILDENWNMWIDEIMYHKTPGCFKWMIEPGEYLEDLLIRKEIR